MSKSTGKSEPTGYSDFAVRAEVIGGFFSPPLASSTFHDLVNKGKIVPMKGIRGFYKLNESLSRLGLREVKEPPKPPASRSLEDIVRLAFTLIDRNIFPEPSWLLFEEALPIRDADHAVQLAARYRSRVEALEHVELKLAYFQGVLDGAAKMEREGDSRTE